MQKSATETTMAKVRTDYGLEFDSQEELEAWEKYIDARLAAAEKSPIVEHEEALRVISEMIKKCDELSYSLA